MASNLDRATLALRNADAAGDVPAATKLAGFVRSMMPKTGQAPTAPIARAAQSPGIQQPAAPLEAGQPVTSPIARAVQGMQPGIQADTAARQAAKPKAPEFTLGKGELDPEMMSVLTEFGVGMLPGAGDVMSLQDSQAAGQRMKEAFDKGDMGGAFGAFLESLAGGLGALPMIPGMVRMFHGSPHKFAPEPGAPAGRFDFGKIGTGEGAQAFGHGLYFAENPKVAGQYRKDLAGTGVSLTLDGKRVTNVDVIDVLDGKVVDPRSALFGADVNTARALDRIQHEGGVDQALAYLARSKEEWVKSGDSPRSVAATDRMTDVVESLRARVGVERSGALYDVHLDVAPEDLLDWDVPLSQQSPKVKKALEPLLRPLSATTKADDELLARLLEGTGSAEIKEAAKTMPLPDYTGREIYHQLVGGGPNSVFDSSSEAAAKASRALNEAGIPGLRYFDGGSRKAGDGTRNIVMFDDKLIKIEGVDGKAVKQSVEAASKPATAATLGPIRSPSKAVLDEAIFSNFVDGRVVGNKTKKVSDLLGGIDPEVDTESMQRVDRLVEQIRAKDGFF
ncbi:MAG TPA: hypothetical protein VMW68_08470, partial [Methyloceanibacter sp.]|nr:hypothetical protein [Methyloceanibacter sp.]